MKEIKTFMLPITREAFTTEVKSVLADKNIPVMDAIIDVCARHEIELEDVAPLIDARMKMELENEFREMNYLPKIAQLPL
jgi:hypothetical protein